MNAVDFSSEDIEVNLQTRNEPHLHIQIDNFLSSPIFRYHNIWSELGELKFKEVVELELYRIIPKVLQLSTKSKSEYLKSEFSQFRQAYCSTNMNYYYCEFLGISELSCKSILDDINMNINNHLQKNNLNKNHKKTIINEINLYLAAKKDILSIQLETSSNNFKILHHNFDKKNCAELCAAEKKLFGREAAVIAAVNKSYETLLLCYLAFLESHTYIWYIEMLSSLINGLNCFKK